ncbi:MAG TPA: hypothetical protein VHE35_19400 [Kofleriaceae bacterium]|nr:hypothetical protein [Kofleriaceae bacterium]
MICSFGLAAAGLHLAACGPTASGGADDDSTNPGGDDDDDDTPTCTTPSPEGTAATCSDGVDNDCDGNPDCSDPDCSGVGSCPVCGMVDTSAGNGITLPDGIIGDSCTTDAQCGGGTPNCVENECHASYVSTLNVIGFGDNQTFQDPALIKSVCANMEHSWLRDMEIRLRSPDGKIVRLQKFLGRTGGEVYLGQANDCDEGNPQPGVGAMYCWKPDATNPPMLDYANNGGAMNQVDTCDGGDFGFTADELPPGDYSAADPWQNFVGSPLNGDWSILVTDLWPIDNGFIFDWTIQFDPNAVTDCSGPIIGRSVSGTPGRMQTLTFSSGDAVAQPIR